MGYKRNKKGSWKLLKKIEGDEGDKLGFRVAMSTNTIVAGAPLANNNKGYVIVVDTLISPAVIRLEDIGGSPFSRFGTSVGISEDGEVIVVGSGSEGLWVEFEFESLGDFELKGYDPQVALSGNTIAVGLKNGFNNNGVQTGVVFILTAKIGSDALTWEKT